MQINGKPLGTLTGTGLTFTTCKLPVYSKNASTYGEAYNHEFYDHNISWKATHWNWIPCNNRYQSFSSYFLYKFDHFSWL